MSKTFPRSLSPLLLPALLLVGACESTEPSPPVPTELRVAGDSVHLFVGEGAVVSASVLDARGRPVSDAELLWSSSDPAVASVDSAGHILGLRPGRADVTVRVQGASGISESIAVGVEPRPDRLELPQDTFLFQAPGQGCSRTVVAARYDRSGQRVPIPHIRYSVEDTTVAGYTTPPGGTAALFTIYLYGKRPGETRLIASSDLYRDTAKIQVLPGTPSRVRIAAAASGFYGTLTAGDTVHLQGQVLNECAGVVPELSPTFSSDDPSVAEVSPAGRLVGRTAGRTYVRATWNGVSDSVAVSVYELRLLPADTTATVGDTITYRAYIASSPGEFRPWYPTFSTSDSTVARLVGARVENEQRVLAAGAGEAQVVASGIGSARARLRVVEQP